MVEMMIIEVCYVLLVKQELVSVKFFVGVMLGQVFEVFGLLQKYLEIDLKKNKFGIFVKLFKLDMVLCECDCVEIYWLLIVDLKEVWK